MRVFAIVLLSIGAVGCYNPSPPGGSYLCTTDNKCPSGQSCVCGLCVDHPTQAACKFALATPSGAATLNVAEHESFNLTVSSLTADGTPANEFEGEVELSSSWGDIRPAKVKLTNGVANVTVSLNRETLSPQTAKVRATFNGYYGESGKVAVSVTKLTRADEPVVPPASQLKPFGWASAMVAMPQVIKVDSGYRMYFVGVDAKSSDRAGFGIATSSDAKTWTPMATPALTLPSSATNFGLESPTVFQAGDGTFHALVSRPAMSASGRELSLGTSPDGLNNWSIFNNGAAVLKQTDCAYCSAGVDFPWVLPDPTTLDATGKPTAWILFFNAVSGGGLFPSVSIGRAQTTDGVTFVPEPAPLLSGDLTGEAYLVSPRVLVDGTVWKMWYSFARTADIVNPDDLCGVNNKVGVGYATSDDGFYWIRSPSNPVLEPSDTGWDKGDRVVLVSSVIASDGVDPQNGIDLYYTSFRRNVVLECLPNGIGKATRP